MPRPLQVLALGDIGVTVPDLQTFRDGAEEEIFAHDVPPFPIERQKAAAPSFSQRGEVRVGCGPGHSPQFLRLYYALSQASCLRRVCRTQWQYLS